MMPMMQLCSRHSGSQDNKLRCKDLTQLLPCQVQLVGLSRTNFNLNWRWAEISNENLISWKTRCPQDALLQMRCKDYARCRTCRTSTSKGWPIFVKANLGESSPASTGYQCAVGKSPTFAAIKTEGANTKDCTKA